MTTQTKRPTDIIITQSVFIDGVSLPVAKHSTRGYTILNQGVDGALLMYELVLDSDVVRNILKIERSCISHSSAFVGSELSSTRIFKNKEETDWIYRYDSKLEFISRVETTFAKVDFSDRDTGLILIEYRLNSFDKAIANCSVQWDLHWS